MVGNVTAKAAKETGLTAGISVSEGPVDCNAGWVGGRAILAGVATDIF
jgi:xylulokinase